eukprot:2026010-Alexandrium_andersonii.AAC.1
MGDRRGVDGLGPVRERKVLPSAEGTCDDVGRVSGIEADTNPRPRPNVTLCAQPKERFSDGGDLSCVVAGDLGAPKKGELRSR